MDHATSVGRIVHYVSQGSPVLPDGTQKYKSVCRAAVIVEVGVDGSPGVVSLCVLNPTGIFFGSICFHDEDTKAAGSWHWPERV